MQPSLPGNGFHDLSQVVNFDPRVVLDQLGHRRSQTHINSTRVSAMRPPNAYACRTKCPTASHVR